MGLEFRYGEHFAMLELVLENEDEVVFRTDQRGFVCDASSSIRLLGFPLVEMLIGPHVRELVEAPFRSAVDFALDAALADRGPARWIEFRPAGPGGAGRWLAMRISGLRDENGTVSGTLGIIRNIGETKRLQERLFRAELTDPLTGVTNRQAWLQMLELLTEAGAASALAIVDIDFFKAINLHHGLATGDRFLIGFADFLRDTVPGDVSISRIGGSRFGLLFPGWQQDRAHGVCRTIVESLASLKCSDWQGRFSITASIGLTPVIENVDLTVRAGEAALRLARAKGGNTVATIPAAAPSAAAM